ncbi:hypothetical protein JXA02_09110 [candidate division KSB1 bacterium]|nr:hypothetical protein [candidate division KSB1 bacterium]RQW04680.1 MAG: hypothetical protein EH222_10790 [candidate division KSB1 bacterium]
MEAINSVALQWWTWMASMFWQVSLLIIIISGIDFLLRKWAWPQVRHALWLLVLLKLLIPPTWSAKTSIVSFLQPRLREQIVQRLPMGDDSEEKSRPTESTRPAILDQTINSAVDKVKGPNIEIEPGFAHTAASPSWQTIAMAIWALGMSVLLSLLIGKMMRLRRWHSQQKKRAIPQWFHELLVRTAQQYNITHMPAIVFNDKARSPAVYGMFRPVMLLPTNYFDNLSEDEAQHVLLHELAHLKRGDLWLHGLTLMMQIIYWFNPLLIWARRQMKHVREICCDLTVANVLRDKTPAYRQTLLNTARELLTETVEPGLGMLGVFEEPFRLVTRLKWLEKKTWEHRKRILGTAAVLSLLAAASLLPMAAGSADESSDAGTSKRQKDGAFANAPRLGENEQWRSDAFTIKETSEFFAAVLVKTGYPDDHFEEAVEECRRLLKRQRIKPLGDPFARYFSDPDEVPIERRYWEVGFRIKKNAKLKPPLEIRRFLPMQVASHGVAGIRNTESTWYSFFEQLDKAGYVPCFPPAVEIYRGEKYDAAMWQYTEMQIPVFKVGNGYPGLNIEYRKSDPFRAVVLPMSGSTAQLDLAIGQLQNHLKKNNIEPAGKLFGEYYFDWSKSMPSEWEWLVGYPIEGSLRVDPPFEIRSFQSTDIAAAFLRASPDAEYPWSPFVMEMILAGYIPIGAPMEIWDDADRKETRIEMRMPVMRMPESSEMPPTDASAEEWRKWGEKVGQESEEWALNFADDLVSALTGHSIAELEAQEKSLENIQDRVERTNAILARALIEQDLETYGRYIADDIIADPPLHKELSGSDTYLAMMMDDFQRGVKFHTFNSRIMQCWQCRQDIYEISSFSFSLTTPESPHPWVANGNSFSIWQQASDGHLKVTYTIYTTESHPNL